MTVKDRTPQHFRCTACWHVWIGMWLPLPIDKAAKALKNATCPMCAAGADKIRMAPRP